MVWMKPCSIIIELFPVGFYLPNYFDGLSTSVYLIKYPYQVSFHSTVRSKLLTKRPVCKQYYEKLYNNIYNNDMCIDNGECRSCTRGADGVIVNTTIIQSIIYEMMIKRKTCIKQHPLYQPTSP